MTQDTFYLSSHDLAPDSRPWRCERVRKVKGLRRPSSYYLLVQVDRPVITSFQDGPERPFDQLILALVGEQTAQDIGVSPVMVAIVISPVVIPDTQDTVDEWECSKIGTGALHASYAEALEHSPMGDD